MAIGAGVFIRAIIPENARPELLWATLRAQQEHELKKLVAKADALTKPWKHPVWWKARYERTATHESLMVWTTDPVFKYLDQGTKRHFVKPKFTKALHWPKGHGGYFSKGHWVSGIKARHYMRTIREEFMKTYRANMQFAMSQGASRARFIQEATPGRIRMR